MLVDQLPLPVNTVEKAGETEVQSRFKKSRFLRDFHQLVGVLAVAVTSTPSVSSTFFALLISASKPRIAHKPFY